MNTAQRSHNKSLEVAIDQHMANTTTLTSAEPLQPSVQRPMHYPFAPQSNIARLKVPTIASSPRTRIQQPNYSRSNSTTSPTHRPIQVNMSKHELITTSNKRSRVKSRRSERKRKFQQQHDQTEASPMESEIDKDFTVVKHKKKKARIDPVKNKSPSSDQATQPDGSMSSTNTSSMNSD